MRSLAKGSIIAFQVGSDDAERLALQIGKFPGQISPENLTGLPKYTAYTRLLIDGMPSKPFSITTLPPPQNDADSDRAEIIRRVSKRRFGGDPGSVEAAGVASLNQGQ